MFNEPSAIIDPRHQKRIELMQALFAYTFFDPEDWLDSENRTPEVDEIVAAIPQLDEQIQQFAPERPLKDINKVDLAILRIIVFESNHHKTPVKVLIDEAVELAKEFGSDTSPKFINGVLGKFFGSDQHDNDK
jgi:N utilization substance protein B